MTNNEEKTEEPKITPSIVRERRKRKILEKSLDRKDAEIERLKKENDKLKNKVSKLEQQLSGKKPKPILVKPNKEHLVNQLGQQIFSYYFSVALHRTNIPLGNTRFSGPDSFTTNSPNSICPRLGFK